VEFAFSIWISSAGFVVLIEARYNAELLQEASGGDMADKEGTVKELMEALKQFPLEAKVLYETGLYQPGVFPPTGRKHTRRSSRWCRRRNFPRN
jgi:hypothetical protein